MSLFDKLDRYIDSRKNRNGIAVMHIIKTMESRGPGAKLKSRELWDLFHEDKMIKFYVERGFLKISRRQFDRILHELAEIHVFKCWRRREKKKWGRPGKKTIEEREQKKPRRGGRPYYYRFSDEFDITKYRVVEVENSVYEASSTMTKIYIDAFDGLYPGKRYTEIFCDKTELSILESSEEIAYALELIDEGRMIIEHFYEDIYGPKKEKEHPRFVVIADE